MSSITDKKIKNVDVLLGRGRGINCCPGNIRFRKLVNQHRHDYVTAKKPDKSKIAARIVKAVHKSRGKFLGLNPRTKRWEEVPIERAMEKACQALRDHGATVKMEPSSSKRTTSKRKRKDEPNIHASQKKPAAAAARKLSIKSNKRDTTEATNSNDSKPRAKERRLKAKSKSEVPESASLSDAEEDHQQHQEEESRQAEHESEPLKEVDYSASHDRIELAELCKEERFDSDEDSIEEVFEDDPNAKPYRWLGSSSGANTTSSEEEWDSMHQRMMRYRHTLGHCAIPPNWAGGVDLADWACRQRQLYREIVQTCHRDPTKFEQRVIEKLNDVDFVWDYDDWRWNQCFNDIVRRMDDDGMGQDGGIGLSESKKIWLEQQQRLATMGNLSLEKAAKLHSLSQRLAQPKTQNLRQTLSHFSKVATKEVENESLLLI